jgi:hypothetical protein
VGSTAPDRPPLDRGAAGVVTAAGVVGAIRTFGGRADIVDQSNRHFRTHSHTPQPHNDTTVDDVARDVPQQVERVREHRRPD